MMHLERSLISNWASGMRLLNVGAYPVLTFGAFLRSFMVLDFPLLSVGYNVDVFRALAVGRYRVMFDVRGDDLNADTTPG